MLSWSAFHTRGRACRVGSLTCRTQCRYQYLELASFLTHGLCVNATDPGEHGYYLSHQGYSSWHEFYTKSSDALNFQSALLNTRSDMISSWLCPSWNTSCSLNRPRFHATRQTECGKCAQTSLRLPHAIETHPGLIGMYHLLLRLFGMQRVVFVLCVFSRNPGLGHSAMAMSLAALSARTNAQFDIAAPITK